MNIFVGSSAEGIILFGLNLAYALLVFKGFNIKFHFDFLIL